MSKFNIKNILTFLYSLVVSVLLYLFLYMVSKKIGVSFTELLFLFGLALLLIGIVVVMSRNQIRMGFFRQRQKLEELSGDEDDEEGEEDEDFKQDKAGANILLYGFNSLTIVLTGVILLIVDAILK